eukprot:TRINITY_DN7665_c2_g1_i1.p2 TRINITY_DN7665_c2_g1~~TRINITY_DN7665_c2_g1_i1.p2  ORF type:complete len:140 (+),score=31.69 TRINITY_DN7665_c2_g1_i1:65-421(+)
MVAVRGGWSPLTAERDPLGCWVQQQQQPAATPADPADLVSLSMQIDALLRTSFEDILSQNPRFGACIAVSPYDVQDAYRGHWGPRWKDELAPCLSFCIRQGFFEDAALAHPAPSPGTQ